MADTNFADALAAWKEINLAELQKTLDAQGVELVQNQKESVVGRKVLADKTREFKKLPDEDKLGDFKGLLKAYQSEIDNLTRRTKSAETAFLSAYKILAEAPDPYPLLDAAVDQLTTLPAARDLEASNTQLRAEVAELKMKVGDLEDVDAARRRAEERADALEKRMEENLQTKLLQKESELNATYDERLRNSAEREADLQRQLTTTKAQLRDMRSSNESKEARLMDQTQRQDGQVIGKLVEMDMMVADLERANSRVAAVERRNELLRAEIEGVRTGMGGDEKTRALESRIAELEAEASRLLRALESQKTAFEDGAVGMNRKLAEAAKDLASKSSEIEALKTRLKMYADYDEIKRELEIMKYVEFAAGDAEEGDSDVRLPDPNASKANQQQAKSLETLLATKNRRMLEELTRFRVLHSELEESYRTASEELATCRAELEKQKILTERLENDLMHVDRHMANGERPSGTGTSTPSQSTDALSGLNLGSTSERSVRYTPIPFSSTADTSILPIVTSQRDRFRQRNAELEEELRKQFETISELRTDIKTLQADNLKLYEKIRYMQSYQDEGPIGSSTAGPSNVAGTSYTRAAPSTGARRDDLGKYRSLYEQNMNPFEAFRGREAVRAVQALNPLERGVLTLTQAILGNRRTRLKFIKHSALMVANNPSDLVLSDSAWEVVQYIVQCAHLESFPGLFELIGRYYTDPDWKQALHTYNGSRAWHISACRSLGSAPPFPDDPMRTNDVEAAVQAFLVIFGGGRCSCGRWLNELPFSYVDGEVEWKCETTCQQNSNSRSPSPSPLAMRSNESTKWNQWRRSAHKAFKDPASLSTKRLRSKLTEWFEWSSWEWKDALNSPPVLTAIEGVRFNGVPLSSDGCERLARVVMQHFTDLENNKDSEAEDMDQWDDVLCDDDENTPPLGSKGHVYVAPLLKAPLGAALLNRIPTLNNMIGRKDYV